MKLLKNHKNILAAAAIFFICLTVFFCFWEFSVKENQSNDYDKMLYEAEELETVSVPSGRTITQRFTTEYPLYKIAVCPMYDAETLFGVFQVRLLDADGDVLAVASLDANLSMANQFYYFAFRNPVKTQDGVYILEFIAETDQDFRLASGADVPDGWELVIDGEAVSGSLQLHATVERLGAFIGWFYLIFAVVTALAVSALYCLSRRKKIALHKLYFIAALMIGTLFNVILPAYSVPDERFHINETFNLSSYWLGDAPRVVAWGENVKRADDFDEFIETNMPTGQVYKRIAENLFTLSDDSSPATYDSEGVGGYRLPYYPAAAAVTAGRLLNLGYVPVLLLGRFMNLLLYALLAALAVKLAPFGKGIFIAVSLLPMNMHLAASFSRDMLINVLCLLYTAYCLYLIYQKESVCERDLLLLLLMAVAVLPAKVVYSPVVLMIALIPREKLMFFGKKVSVKVYRAVIGGAVGIILLIFTLLLVRLIISQIEYAASLDPETWRWTSRYDITYIFSHFGDTIRLLFRSLFYQMGDYLRTLVGGSLGYWSINVNQIFVFLCWLFLIVSAIPEREAHRLGKKESAAGIFLSLLSGALVVAACIAWTPTDSVEIYGIQGRYFLPALPLLLCGVRSRIKTIERRPGGDWNLLFGMAAVNFCVLLNAFLIVAAH